MSKTVQTLLASAISIVIAVDHKNTADDNMNMVWNSDEMMVELLLPSNVVLDSHLNRSMLMVVMLMAVGTDVDDFVSKKW